jgi:photosystem II stability/assembly factor-like uncharacterized protein
VQVCSAVRGLVLGLLLLGAAALVACGGDDDEPAGEPASRLAVPWLDPDGEFPVVGSLAVNPADGVLWMATNTGLFRVPDGAARPERVTGTLTTPDGAGKISAQLVVQFVGPDELLGSGHPAAEETGLPTVLGLIRSDDAARSWTSVSELGGADFHAIEVSGDRIAGALSGQSQVFVSEDRGRTWTTRAAPRALIDLAVDPDAPDRWAATTSDGVYLSDDAGGSWRPVDVTPNSYLAWPAADTLYRLDPGGPLKRSSDGGRRWEDVGDTGGEPQALAAADPETLYAALLDGTVKRSADGGRSWTSVVSPPD